VILLAAKFFAEIFSRLSIPSVLGEVVAGLIIGPSVLGFVAPEATLRLIAEIGILLLLFEVGLETDVGQLVQEGVRSTLVAATGVVAPGALGFGVSYYLFGMAMIPSLFVGGTIVATSIGITVRVLKDLNRHTTRMARIVLGAAVLDDVIGVVVLAVLYDFAVKGAVSVPAALRILVFITSFLLVAPVLAKLFVPVMAKLAASSRTKGMIPTLIISLILGLAVISHGVGAPEILGSFAAGIAHLMTHAYFKALLFLGAGSVIHAIRDAHAHAGYHGVPQDIRYMGGLRRKLPTTYWTFAVGCLVDVLRDDRERLGGVRASRLSQLSGFHRHADIRRQIGGRLDDEFEHAIEECR